MTTRWLRFAQWQYRSSLRKQALAQESAAAPFDEPGRHSGHSRATGVSPTPGWDCPTLQGEGDLPDSQS